MNGRYRDVLRFFGRRVLILLGWGAAAGVAVSAVEIAFAFSLQAFFVRVGVMDASVARLPGPLATLGLYAVLALIIAVGVLRALLYGLQIYLNGAAQVALHKIQRSRLLRWAYHAPSASAGDVFNLFNARVEAAGQVAGSLQTLATQWTSALLIGLSLLRMNWRLTLALGGALLVLLPPLRWADRRTRVSGENQSAEWQKLSLRLMAGIKNLVLLQIYGTQRLEERRSQESLDAACRHNLDYYRVLGFKVGLPQAFGVVLICLVALAPGSHGSGGILVGFLYLFLRLVQLFSTSSQAMGAALVNWPQARGLLEWWTAHERETVAVHADGAVPFPAPVGFRVVDAAFQFPGGAKPVFEGLSLEIAPGGAAALVGPSGAGKSTLLALLLGSLTPDSGSVELLEGKAARPLAAERARLLRSVGYVGPESYLVEGTLKENLLYGLGREPSDAELEEALRQAECSFVFELPGGLSHRLTEQGHGVSAGQKQRLSLARALLRQPTVLVLDEATSNLDAATEERLVETLARLKGRMTLVIATHREALLKLSDRVLRLS